MIAFLQIVNGILDLRPVQYLLLGGVVVLFVGGLFLRSRLGIVTLERDAALGREAQLSAAIQLQNQAVLQANEKAKQRLTQLREAEDKAIQLRIERDKWKKDALNKPLTGDCDQMVNQVLESLK